MVLEELGDFFPLSFFFLLLHFSDTQDTSLHIVPTTLRFLEEFTKEEEDQKLLESRPIDTQSSMHAYENVLFILLVLNLCDVVTTTHINRQTHCVITT